MKKLIVFCLFTLITSKSYCQVGVNTSNPQGTFHVDANKNNPILGTPDVNAQKDDFIVLPNGNVGIGTITPENKLHIKSDTNPLKIEGLQAGKVESEQLLTIDTNGIVKAGTLQSASIPQPAVLALTQDMVNFLSGSANGQKQTLKNVQLIKNSIPGLTYDSATSTVVFPKGTYQINYVYEALHNAPNCTLSSYFVDFPSPDASRRRIHTTGSHIVGGLSNHGGTISFAVNLPVEKSWIVEFGRGQSGNCQVANNNTDGMTLFKNSTQILIFRIGD